MLARHLSYLPKLRSTDASPENVSCWFPNEPNCMTSPGVRPKSPTYLSRSINLLPSGTRLRMSVGELLCRAHCTHASPDSPRATIANRKIAARRRLDFSTTSARLHLRHFPAANYARLAHTTSEASHLSYIIPRTTLSCLRPQIQLGCCVHPLDSLRAPPSLPTPLVANNACIRAQLVR